jgi:hypothetical protein
MKKLVTQEEWAEWLEKMHAEMGDFQENMPSRYETAAAVLGIVTYDGSMDEVIVRTMMPTLLAIGNKTTFELIEDPKQYAWFCITVNMPFLQQRLEWGTSIRGAWYKLDNEFDPHEGVIGTGSSGCDIIDAEPLRKGDEEAFFNLIKALDAFVQIPDQVPELTTPV